MKPFNTLEGAEKAWDNLLNGGTQNVCDFCNEEGTAKNRVYFDPIHKTRSCKRCIDNDPDIKRANGGVNITESELLTVMSIDEISKRQPL